MVSKKSRSEVRRKKHMKLRNRFSGTAERPRLVPDRLREPVPRLAGHEPAPAFPVARQGVHPLVALLRRDEEEDAREPRLGAVLRGARPEARPAHAGETLREDRARAARGRQVPGVV